MPIRASISAELEREEACGLELVGPGAETAKLGGDAGPAALAGKGADIGAGTETGGIVPLKGRGADGADGWE